MEEEINKEIDKNSKNYAVKNNKECSLSSSELAYEYFLFASNVNSSTTIHANDEHSESNESEIYDDFYGAESYDSEQQRNLDIQAHPKETQIK